MRKFHEVKLLSGARAASKCRSIGNVYLLNRAVARLFHSGKLAGCVVSDALLERIEKYAAGPDKGRKFFQRAGRQAVGRLQGAGLRRRLPGRDRQSRDLRRDHRPGRELRPGRLAGLHARDPVLPARRVLPLRARPDYRPERARRGSTPSIGGRWIAPCETENVTLGYRLSRRVHQWAFTRGKGSMASCVRLFRRWDSKPGWLAGWPIGWRRRPSSSVTAARTAAIAACPTAPISARWPPARSTRGTAPAAAPAAVAASWTTRSASGPAFTSG